MANINLYQNSQEEERISQSRMVDIGMIFAIVFFFLAMAAYGGVYLYLSSLDKQIEAAKQREAAGRAMLKIEDVNQVASAQQRIENIQLQNDAFEGSDPEKIFNEFQSLMVGGAVLSKLSLTDGSLSVGLVADDLQVAANQLASFRKSSLFTSPEIKSFGVQDDGKIDMTLGMALNN